MKQDNKFHLLPANLEYFDMQKLKQEIDNNKFLIWHNNKSNGNRIHIYETGDIVYIYYKNLTDGSNRILFRGEVINPDYQLNENNINIRCIKIGNLRSISLKDKNNFCYKNINKNYGIEIYRTPETLCTFEEYTNKINSTQNRKVLLVEKLEETYQKEYSTINETFQYFNENRLCDCCKLLNIKNWKNRTFIKSNGFVYYEIHHLLMQNLIRNKDKNKLDWLNPNIIDKDFNKINLCPVCHREIHYGENRKQMLDEIIKFKEVRKNLKNELNVSERKLDEIIEFIYKQYNI